MMLSLWHSMWSNLKLWITHRTPTESGTLCSTHYSKLWLLGTLVKHGSPGEGAETMVDVVGATPWACPWQS